MSLLVRIKRPAPEATREEDRHAKAPRRKERRVGRNIFIPHPRPSAFIRGLLFPLTNANIQASITDREIKEPGPIVGWFGFEVVPHPLGIGGALADQPQEPAAAGAE